MRLRDDATPNRPGRTGLAGDPGGTVEDDAVERGTCKVGVAKVGIGEVGFSK